MRQWRHVTQFDIMDGNKGHAATDTPRTCLAIILAAGEGTRMRSDKPKVMHEIAGRPMLGHVLSAVQAAGATRIAVVIGPDRTDVAETARAFAPDCAIFEQRERLGTAHAVLAAREALEDQADDVIIAFADTPLIDAAGFTGLRAPLAQGAVMAVLRFRGLQSDGLWPADRRERQSPGYPRREGCKHRGKADLALQCRPDGVPGGRGAGPARRDWQRQCQGRVLPYRCRCACSGAQ